MLDYASEIQHRLFSSPQPGLPPGLNFEDRPTGAGLWLSIRENLQRRMSRGPRGKPYGQLVGANVLTAGAETPENREAAKAWVANLTAEQLEGTSKKSLQTLISSTAGAEFAFTTT